MRRGRNAGLTLAQIAEIANAGLITPDVFAALFCLAAVAGGASPEEARVELERSGLADVVPMATPPGLRVLVVARRP